MLAPLLARPAEPGPGPGGVWSLRQRVWFTFFSGSSQWEEAGPELQGFWAPQSLPAGGGGRDGHRPVWGGPT